MTTKNTYILYELAAGYSLFLRKESGEIEQLLPEVQASCSDFSKFSSMVKLVSFVPFTTADEALENMNAITKGEVTEFLTNFLTHNITTSKKSQAQLGVSDVALGQVIKEKLGIPCVYNDAIHELTRWIRFHQSKFLPDHKESDLIQAQLGLSHGYSRTLMRLNVNRSDNMIIQAVCLLDQMDKDINTFTMRVQEWYSWHFPELRKIIVDRIQYCKLAVLIKNKSSLTSENLESIQEIVGDEEKANEVISTAAISMGMDFTEQDFQNIECFAQRVVRLASFRSQLFTYLTDKMNTVAPNLAALMGEQIGGQLIAKAGSLTNLAKYPSSTLQILGAEKALFRALKTKTNTPKYGLIFHSGYISKASKENKGKIARFVANKATLCTRIDCFMETPNRVIGQILAAQVDARLKSFGTGEKITSNQQTMEEAVQKYVESLGKKAKESAASADDAAEQKRLRKEEKKKRKLAQQAEAEAVVEEVAAAEEPKKKKKRKAQPTEE